MGASSIITLMFLSFKCFCENKSIETPLRKLENFKNFSVEKDTSIFFLETSFVFYVYRKLWVTTRAACGVESAAIHHPNRTVHLVFASPDFVPDSLQVLNNYLDVLESYPNIRVSQMNIEEYLEDTPVEKFYSKGNLDLSPYRIDHYSDVLRATLLWQNGGIYFDHDVIVLKPFDSLGSNFIGAEDEWYVVPGVMGFSHRGPGHDLLTKVLRDLGKNYSGDKFGEIGPDIFTNLIKNVCRISNIFEVIDKSCSSIRILNSKYFYAISFFDWPMFFNESCNEEVFKRTRNSYAVHLWYTLSRHVEIQPNTNVPFVNFAKKHCPMVYKLFSENSYIPHN